jgi:ParB-like chromosome segregation protein Spo0J
MSRAAARKTSIAGFGATAPAAPPLAEEALPLPAEVPLDHLRPSPLNPRRAMDRPALEDLARSLVAKGQLQSLLVRPAPDGGPHYEIVAGARRWTAAKLARDEGVETSPGKREFLPKDFRLSCKVRPCSDAELVTLAATENLAREDMHPLDEAAVFDAMRKTVEARPGETAEGAVARTLGLGERTVWRRLALLRCAEPVRAALREGKVTMQQAGALALGPAKAQAAYLPRLIQAAKNPDAWEARLASIRQAMISDMIPVKAALFPREAYAGPIARDDESGEEFFADRKAFLALQTPAIEAKLEELRASGKYPWVERLEGGAAYSAGYEYAQSSEKKKAGALVIVEQGGASVRIALREYIKAADRKAAAKLEKAKAEGRDPEQAEEKHLTERQLVAVKAAKTRALRLAVGDRPKVALALTILGLLGGRGVHIRDARGEQPGQLNQVEPAKRQVDRAAKALRPVKAAIEKADRKKGDGMFSGWSAEGQAIVFRALVALELDELLELLAILAADRVGCWFEYKHNGANEIGDSALEVAIAEETEAAAELAGVWRPDAEYFKPYPRPMLQRLALANGLGEGFHSMKKSELVELFARQPRGFWSPAKFSELGFGDEATLRKALDGPAPVAAELRDAAE